MDADYVDTRSDKKKAKEMLSGKNKKRSKFSEALLRKKPVFDPSKLRSYSKPFFIFHS